MQTEKSQPKGKWRMPETRFTEFPALSVDLRVGISQSASETDDRLFFLPIIIMPHHKKVTGYYVIPSELLSVYTSVCRSVSG